MCLGRLCVSYTGDEVQLGSSFVWNGRGGWGLTCLGILAPPAVFVTIKHVYFIYAWRLQGAAGQSQGGHRGGPDAFPSQSSCRWRWWQNWFYDICKSYSAFTLSLSAHNAPYNFHPVPFSPQCSIQISPCPFQPTMLHTTFTLYLSAHNAPYNFHPVPFSPQCSIQISPCTFQICSCIPDGHLHRVTYARYLIDTISSSDNGHVAVRNM